MKRLFLTALLFASVTSQVSAFNFTFQALITDAQTTFIHGSPEFDTDLHVGDLLSFTATANGPGQFNPADGSTTYSNNFFLGLTLPANAQFPSGWFIGAYSTGYMTMYASGFFTIHAGGFGTFTPHADANRLDINAIGGPALFDVFEEFAGPTYMSAGIRVTAVPTPDAMSTLWLALPVGLLLALRTQKRFLAAGSR